MGLLGWIFGLVLGVGWFCLFGLSFVNFVISGLEFVEFGYLCFEWVWVFDLM